MNNYNKIRIEHWNSTAKNRVSKRSAKYYHKRLGEIYRFLIPPSSRVLEIGCGKGDLLASLNPSVGIGIDFSTEMIGLARQKYPNLKFSEADAHSLNIDEKFDFIILSDLANDLWDVQRVLERIRQIATPRTRVIMNLYSRLWEQPLMIAQKLGLVLPTLPQNWLTAEDITNLLALSEFEVIRSWQEVLWPFSTPLLSTVVNKYLVKLWPFKKFALTNFIIARSLPKENELTKDHVVSVIIPARNESGNISKIVSRIPKMGKETELIFIEGDSKDDTYKVIEKVISDSSKCSCKLFKQNGIGKADAVRLGFEKAKGDVLMILDADMTVPPEDLPRFYEVIRSGKAEFVNGVRLVYPMENEAMRFFNLLGNKFFSWAFSWLLGQPIKDTLCGTKVLWKADYNSIEKNRSYFGEFDPFGDFDLLFGAVKLNLKIADLPIRYRERTYGDTNISRWRHGWLLLRMVCFAARRMKFI